jgi:phosphoglucosamine mutase
VDEIILFPQVNKSIVVKNKPQLDSVPSIQKAIKKAEERLNGKGRTLLRYSGTEPLLRVMVEGDNQQIVEEECQNLINVVTKEIG